MGKERLKMNFLYIIFYFLNKKVLFILVKIKSTFQNYCKD